MSGLSRGNWSSTSNSNQHPFDSNQSLSEIIRTDHPIIQPGINEYDSIYRVDPANRQLVTGYTRMVTDRVDDGWSCHLVTATFRQLPGPRSAVIESIKDELSRVYSTFLTRTH